jgi:hypothetical protein
MWLALKKQEIHIKLFGKHNKVFHKSGTIGSIGVLTHLLQNMINLSTNSCNLSLTATSTQQIDSTRSSLFNIVTHNCYKKDCIAYGSRLMGHSVLETPWKA